ncbi:hypothetical protein JHK84_056841 [Glycine max]|nr:hypothetical protein JHK85_057814 [Glycine max]KAG5075610.1 hypothetical protein JHK84_056841 [Glycine max]
MALPEESEGGSEDYLKSALPSQIMSERGSNLVVINPGSANVRIGLASQDTPFNIPHCIARHTKQIPNFTVIDQMGRVDGHNPHIRKDLPLTWTNVYEEATNSSVSLETSSKDETGQFLDPKEGTHSKEPNASERKFKEFICGEEALRISPTEPYCFCHPIRRGHLNISQYYSMQQEGLAAVFGNGLSTACVVNIGAQVTSLICIEDGGALPSTGKTLPFGGEDISRAFLWTQRHYQTWSPVHSDVFAKPIDLLMLNQLKETYCEVKEGELDAVAVVHSYAEKVPAVSHKTRLSALNVPPMGLFYPTLLTPDVYPPPPLVSLARFHDYEDMLEDTWHIDFSRRSDMPDTFYPNVNGGLPMWESYPVFSTKPKKEEKVGLAEAITNCILSTDWWGGFDKWLSCSSRRKLMDESTILLSLRVLHAIPPNEAIDTVEVLQSRTNPTFVSWKGGAILGVLDLGRDAWISREDWIHNGVHVGMEKRKKDAILSKENMPSIIHSSNPMSQSSQRSEAESRQAELYCR